MTDNYAVEKFSRGLYSHVLERKGNSSDVYRAVISGKDTTKGGDVHGHSGAIYGRAGTARCDIADVVADYVPLTPEGRQPLGPVSLSRGEDALLLRARRTSRSTTASAAARGAGSSTSSWRWRTCPFPDAVRAAGQAGGAGGARGDRRATPDRRKPAGAAAGPEQGGRPLLPQTAPRAGGAGRGLEYSSASGGCPRGLSPASAWGIAPDGWDSLIEAMAQKGYDKRDLLDAGLAVNKQGRPHLRPVPQPGHVPHHRHPGGRDRLRRPGAGRLAPPSTSTPRTRRCSTRAATCSP